MSDHADPPTQPDPSVESAPTEATPPSRPLSSGQPRPRRRGPTTVRQAILLGLGAMVLVLAGAVLAVFVAGGDQANTPDTSANSGGTLGLAPLGKGSDLIGKKLPQAGVVTLDGTVTDLPAVAGGRPVLVNFFSKTCVPCVKEMPDLQEQFTAAGGKLQIIGVDVGDTADETRAFVAQTKVTYTIVRDPQSLVLNGFGVGTLPTTIAVAPGGTIVGQHYGAFADDDLAAFVAEHFPTED